METFDYKSNSHKSKEAEQTAKRTDEKRVEKVEMTGNVTIKKKNGVEKFADNFFVDSAKNVGGYLLHDVLIPAAKKTLSDLVTNGIEGVLYGRNNRGSSRPTVDRVSYDTAYNSYNYRPDRYIPDQPRSMFDFDRITFSNRGDAEMVLTRLDEVIAAYGQARVSDLYDIIQVSCDYTYNDYGWTNLSTARVVLLRGGYGLDLPRAIPLRR